MACDPQKQQRKNRKQLERLLTYCEHSQFQRVEHSSLLNQVSVACDQNIYKYCLQCQNHIFLQVIILNTIRNTEQLKHTCFGYHIVIKLMKLFVDHEDVEWSLKLIIQRYQLQLVEQICHSQEFAQRYVLLSAALPANKYQIKGWLYCSLSKQFKKTISRKKPNFIGCF